MAEVVEDPGDLLRRGGRGSRSVRVDGREAEEQVRAWLAESRRVVALTGAGMSTDSGIPDYRGPQGTWTLNPKAERMATLQHYLADRSVREEAWARRLSSPVWQARPNAGHLAFVELDRQGRLLAVVTQNIDELHQRAGLDPAKVIEVHGTTHWCVCWSCGDRRPMRDVLDRVVAGDSDPRCEQPDGRGGTCGGILKSDTISFGQALDPAVLARAQEAATSCDLLLAVGSSLTVHPAAGLVPLARGSGARVVIVNAEPTPYDADADAVLSRRIGAVLPDLVAGLGRPAG